MKSSWVLGATVKCHSNDENQFKLNLEVRLFHTSSILIIPFYCQLSI